MEQVVPGRYPVLPARSHGVRYTSLHSFTPSLLPGTASASGCFALLRMKSTAFFVYGGRVNNLLKQPVLWSLELAFEFFHEFFACLLFGWERAAASKSQGRIWSLFCKGKRWRVPTRYLCKIHEGTWSWLIRNGIWHPRSGIWSQKTRALEWRNSRPKCNVRLKLRFLYQSFSY